MDVIDSVFITNADMAEINLNYHPAKTLLTNYRFLDYYSLSENELMEAYEKYGEWITSIIYIANDEIYDESQIAEYLMTAQELFESVIIMTPDRMFLMDYPDVYASYVNYYSLGVRIGKQYMVEAEMDESGELTEYINNFVENYGYFPIIAPETYKNNVFFLMGISDVLGVPVKVLTMKEEIEPALETGELGKCLILDITHMESVYLAQGQIFDLFLQYEYDLADLYIFDSDRNALFDITKYTNHVFFYTLNYDIGAGITVSKFVAFRLPFVFIVRYIQESEQFSESRIIVDYVIDKRIILFFKFFDIRFLFVRKPIEKAAVFRQVQNIFFLKCLYNVGIEF